uniref:Protein MEMO1 n=1 Tax=Peronospora matthiolae TaxID=2874970 RepID=A0AAV1V6R3_9STRA
MNMLDDEDDQSFHATRDGYSHLSDVEWDAVEQMGSTMGIHAVSVMLEALNRDAQHATIAKFIQMNLTQPSHHFYLRGCAVSTAHEYETPLGNIVLDREVNEKLVDSGKFATMSMDVDEDEHSIEMHLPFIYQVMNGREFTAVPILVGNTKSETDEEYGKILAPYLESDENLFVISSDFCHWGPRFRYQPHDSTYGEIHEYIKYLDHQGMGFIERLDAEGFTRYLEETNNTICGRHPISLLLHSILASQKLKYKLKFVKYAQSSACMRYGDSSVSYASAIVYSEP